MTRPWVAPRNGGYSPKGHVSDLPQPPTGPAPGAVERIELTDFEWDCLMDAITTDRESMEDDGDPCFEPHLEALESLVEKIRQVMR